jgi:hypothetical protein
MKCEQVKILLADYLDKKLPNGEMAMVKEHLQQCADCREELQFLKKYMKEIESFPSLKPPDNFLDSIHGRLNRPKRGGVIRKLFVPIRIKVPLEAAALIALALTGVIIFKPFRHGEVEVKTEGPAVGADEKSEKPGPAKDRDLRRERPPMTAKEADTVREMDNEVGTVPDNRVTASQSEAQADLSEITLYLKQNTETGGTMQLRDSIAEQKSERSEETKAVSGDNLAAKKDKAAAERSRQTASPEQYQVGVDSITSLAHSLEGRIIKKEQTTGTVSNQTVIVEIPAKNYARFMDGLRGGWSVQKQYPAAPSRGSSKVRINMNLQN